MTKAQFTLMENYMLSCIEDSAHDREHIYRVLSVALDIARTEADVDFDVLICACLLHDIGRREQFENPSLSHAQVGAEKARRFLLAHGFSDEFAGRVRDCIRTHSYRQNDPPVRIEAKILFDADKIDVTGAIGIARTLIYKGQVGEPLYSLTEDGRVSDGANDAQPSFFQEYRYKLERLYGRFLTSRGAAIAKSRQAAAVAFYDSIRNEVMGARTAGEALLHPYVND